MTKFMIALLTCGLALTTSCNYTDKPGTAGSSSPNTSSPNTPSKVPPEMHALAEKLLGSGAEVLVWSDMAENGRRQALLVNRLSNVQTRAASGMVLRSAALLEQRETRWQEVLRCDEYIKNPKGFLAGTPLIPVTTWQLQVSPHAIHTRIEQLEFTPLPVENASRSRTVTVRWNPKVERYQSFDAARARFLDELALLETPVSELK